MKPVHPGLRGGIREHAHRSYIPGDYIATNFVGITCAYAHTTPPASATRAAVVARAFLRHRHPPPRLSPRIPPGNSQPCTAAPRHPPSYPPSAIRHPSSVIRDPSSVQAPRRLPHPKGGCTIAALRHLRLRFEPRLRHRVAHRRRRLGPRPRPHPHPVGGGRGLCAEHG